MWFQPVQCLLTSADSTVTPPPNPHPVVHLSYNAVATSSRSAGVVLVKGKIINYFT